MRIGALIALAAGVLLLAGCDVLGSDEIPRGDETGEKCSYVDFEIICTRPGDGEIRAVASSGNVNVANIWVVPSGGNDGTAARSSTQVTNPGGGGAFATWAAAYQASQKGDVIAVACGSYTTQTLANRASPAEAAPAVVFAPQRPNCVTVTGVLSVGAEGTGSAVDWVSIYGIKVVGTIVIGYLGSHDSIVRSTVTNPASNYGGPAIHAEDTSYLTLLNNEIKDRCCYDDALQIHTRNDGNPITSNARVVGNYVHDIYGSCREWPTRLGTCNATGFGDVGQSTTLNGAMGSSDATTSLTVTSGFSWLADLTNYFWVQIGTEVLQVNAGASGTSWTIKRGTNCTVPSGYGQQCANVATHASGATVSIYNIGYDHVDGLQALGCDVCTFDSNEIYLQGEYKQGLFLADGNGATYSNLTVTNNIIDSTDAALSFYAPSGFVKIHYNTFFGRVTLPDSGVPDGYRSPAGTPWTVAGNIFGGSFGFNSATNANCTGHYADDSTMTPTFRNNIFQTRAGCHASDTGSSTATFVQRTWPGAGTVCTTGAVSGCLTTTGVPNGHLSGAQTASNGGESTYRPAKDVDATVRPQGAQADIGADEAG